MDPSGGSLPIPYAAPIAILLVNLQRNAGACHDPSDVVVGAWPDAQIGGWSFQRDEARQRKGSDLCSQPCHRCGYRDQRGGEQEEGEDESWPASDRPAAWRDAERRPGVHSRTPRMRKALIIFRRRQWRRSRRSGPSCEFILRACALLEPHRLKRPLRRQPQCRRSRPGGRRAGQPDASGFLHCASAW